MLTWNITALLFAVTLSLVMAIVGGLLTGNQLTQWFATLHKPRFQLPLWGFVCVFDVFLSRSAWTTRIDSGIWMDWRGVGSTSWRIGRSSNVLEMRP